VGVGEDRMALLVLLQQEGKRKQDCITGGAYSNAGRQAGRFVLTLTQARAQKQAAFIRFVKYGKGGGGGG
jgi:hypothetical protein